MGRMKKPVKRKGLMISVAFLAAWALTIVVANLQSAMAGFDRGELLATVEVGFVVLGFPFACGAAYYLLAKLITLTTGRPGGRYFFAGLILLIGLGSLGTGVWETVQGMRSASFPTAEATILQSDMRTETDTSTSESSTGTRRNRTTYTYYFDVTYRYEVNSRSYQGKEYDVSSGSLPRDVAAALPGRYPVDSTAKVFYDPDHPETAYLQPGLAGTWYLLLLVGSFLTALGTFAIRWLEKQWGDDRRQKAKNQV